MAEAKTQKTKESPSAFIAALADEGRRRDCATLVRLMKKATGEPPAMWGPDIIGFGTYHYVYASGHAGDWPVAAFSPRKASLVAYITPGCFDRHPELMRKLGPHRTGKSCLYLKSLADIDLGALEKLVVVSVAEVRKMYPETGAAKPAKPAKKKAAKKVAKPARR
jgi:hypothetical protein